MLALRIHLTVFPTSRADLTRSNNPTFSRLTIIDPLQVYKTNQKASTGQEPTGSQSTLPTSAGFHFVEIGPRTQDTGHRIPYVGNSPRILELDYHSPTWIEPLRRLRYPSAVTRSATDNWHCLWNWHWNHSKRRLSLASCVPIGIPVRRTRHTLHCRHLTNNNALQTADPYSLPACTPAGLVILWHHYRRPRSRKRPTVASKLLRDERYCSHPGTTQ